MIRLNIFTVQGFKNILNFLYSQFVCQVVSIFNLKNTSSGEEQMNIQNFIKEKNCTVKRKTIQTRLFLVELLRMYYLKSF